MSKEQINTMEGVYTVHRGESKMETLAMNHGTSSHETRPWPDPADDTPRAEDQQSPRG